MLDRSHGPHAVPANYSFENDGKYEEITFAPVMAVNDPDPLVAFALEGAGIAVVFEVMSREHLASGALVNVFNDRRIGAELELSVLDTPRATMESKVRVFVEFMLEKVKNMR